jgi:hypothetical protein
MPDAGAGEKAERETLDHVEFGKVPARDRAQQQEPGGRDDPEQIENEQHPEQVIGDDDKAWLGEMPVVDVDLVKPDEERHIGQREGELGNPRNPARQDALRDGLPCMRGSDCDDAIGAFDSVSWLIFP